jgi:hypothetical protein
MRVEGVRERGARAHPIVDIVEHDLEHRVRDPLPEDVERLHERHPRLEQRREFLVEDEKLAAGNLATPRQGRQMHTRECAPTRLLDREDVQPLLLEFAAEPRLVIGDVHAFDDLSARCPEPAAIFHYLEDVAPRLILHN